MHRSFPQPVENPVVSVEIPAFFSVGSERMGFDAALFRKRLWKNREKRSGLKFTICAQFLPFSQIGFPGRKNAPVSERADKPLDGEIILS